MVGMAGFYPVITVEYFIDIPGLYTHAFILYAYDGLAFRYFACYGYCLAFGRIFYGIAQQVGDHGADLVPVGIDDDGIGFRKINGMTGDSEGGLVDHFPDQSYQVEFLPVDEDLSRFQPGYVEEPIDHVVHLLHLDI